MSLQRIPRSWPIYLIAVVLVSSCLDRPAVGERSAEKNGEKDLSMTVENVQIRRGVAGGTGVASATFAGRAPTERVRNTASRQVQLPSQARLSGMIIRNGDVSVEVDSIESSIAAVRQLAASLGGYIGNVSMNTGEHQVRSASLEMKVPAPRFDEAMAGVRPLGKVERSVATAEDVGEEFVDITARVGNARRLEARLVTLLAQRTGKLEDILAVERELARVREEIERYEGRIRYLSSRVATSTIVVTVHEKAPIIATRPGTNVMAQAFLNMWRNFVAVIATGIEYSGAAIPVFVLAWLSITIWKRWRRRPSVETPIAPSAA